jgi:hypothetical protein
VCYSEYIEKGYISFLGQFREDEAEKEKIRKGNEISEYLK